MKRLLLYVLVVICSFASSAQDPDVFGTWDLYRIEIKFSPGLQISDVEPPISPWLTIGEDLEFEGFGACNSFSGTFEYIPNDRVRPVDYVETLLNCETQLHDDIEDEYFGYFKFETVLGFWIIEGTDGLQHLFISTGSPGFNLEFVRSELSLEEYDQASFVLYPNPVSDLLFVSSEKAVIDNILVYNISGQLIMNQAGDKAQLDVSALTPGIYFAEFTSEEGKTVRRFIKK